MGAARTFDDGVIFAMNVLATMLGVKNFQIMAGSTADDPHVRSAIRGILDEAIATTRREAASPDWSVIGPELVEALNDVLSIVAEIHREWDADNDVRVGKLLIALSGNLPKYRADIDAIHVLLSRAQALKERVG